MYIATAVLSGWFRSVSLSAVWLILYTVNTMKKNLGALLLICWRDVIMLQRDSMFKCNNFLKHRLWRWLCLPENLQIRILCVVMLIYHSLLCFLCTLWLGACVVYWQGFPRRARSTKPSIPLGSGNWLQQVKRRWPLFRTARGKACGP